MSSSSTSSMVQSFGWGAEPTADVLNHAYRLVQHQHPQDRIVTVVGSPHGGDLDIVRFLLETGSLDSSTADNLLRLQHCIFQWRPSPPKVTGSQPDSWLMGGDSSSGSIVPKLRSGALTLNYAGKQVIVYRCTWESFGRECAAVLAVAPGCPDGEPARKLLEDTRTWANQLRGEMWTFSECWTKNKELYQAVQAAQPSEVVLPKDLLTRLQRDTHTFFSSRELYKSINAPWKRGLLLIGPPGNGKTQTLRIVIKELQAYPCLYVKSFSHDPSSGIEAIFYKARQCSPCVLVLEDLDSLVNDENRSYFLNQLDGLENNDGILFIATTNHPERIDDALLKRPSRFDSKYYFPLPDEALRARYALKWLTEKVGARQIDFDASDYSDSTVSDLTSLSERIAQETKDWSFAYLKELFLSFLLSKAAGQMGDDPTAAVPYQKILQHLNTLKEQVKDPGQAQDSDEKEQGSSRSGTRFGFRPTRGVAIARPFH